MSLEKLTSHNVKEVIYAAKHAKFYSVIAKLFSTCDGRDKFMKVIQYTLALFMLIGIKPYNLIPKLQPKIQNIIAMFGDTRKVIRLGNFTSNLSKLIYLIQGKGLNPSKKLSELENTHYNLLVLRYTSEMINNFTDDLYCLGKFGILDKSIQPIVKPISINLWWTTLTIDMYLNFRKLINLHSQQELDRLRGDPVNQKLDAEISTLKWTMTKIGADMVFCAYDLFNIKANPHYQHTSGILSGLISASRLWTSTYSSVTY
jgi:hypothetical protein